MSLKLREQYRFDQISLGEVMPRFDPGKTRIRTARQFRAWEGGGEYNHPNIPNMKKPETIHGILNPGIVAVIRGDSSDQHKSAARVQKMLHRS